MSAFDLGPAVLFCPGDRPDRFATAAARSDAVVLDLEDAVAPGRKAAARAAVAAHPVDPGRTVVRVNAVGTPDFDADLAMLAGTAYRHVMVPRADLTLPHDLPYAVVALCQTATGVLAAPDLARRDDVVALMWGAEELIASLGGTSSRRGGGSIGPYRDVARHARSAVLVAAGAAGKAAIDAVHLDIGDIDGLRREVEDAAASGFAATACIHPSHVPVIRSLYAPREADVRRAEAILAAGRIHGGVFVHEGQAVDGTVLRHAETVLRRARAAGLRPRDEAAGPHPGRALDSAE